MKKITTTIFLIMVHLLTCGLYIGAADSGLKKDPLGWEFVEIEGKRCRIQNISKDTLIDNQPYEISSLIVQQSLFYIRVPLKDPISDAGEFEFEFCNRAGILVDQKPGLTAMGIEMAEPADDNNEKGETTIDADADHNSDDGTEHIEPTVRFITREKAVALLITIGASTGMAVAATYATDWYNKEMAPKKEWSKINRRHAAAIAWITTAIAFSSYFYCTTAAESHSIV